MCRRQHLVCLHVTMLAATYYGLYIYPLVSCLKVSFFTVLKQYYISFTPSPNASIANSYCSNFTKQH
jgi:hypothetical protein